MTFRENLRLVLKPPKSARVNNAVTVSFVVVTIRMGGLWMTSSKRLFKGHGITGQFLFASRMNQAFSPPRLKTRRPDLDYSTHKGSLQKPEAQFSKSSCCVKAGTERGGNHAAELQPKPDFKFKTSDKSRPENKDCASTISLQSTPSPADEY